MIFINQIFMRISGFPSGLDFVLTISIRLCS